MPDPTAPSRIAVFLDLENFIGFCSDLGLPIDMEPILKRLLEFGRLSVRRSFGDLVSSAPHLRRDESVGRIRRMLQDNLFLHEDIPHINEYKNTADIRLVVEALSVAYTYPDIDTFVVVAYDRDFMPLFAKLRELGKTIIGVSGSADNTRDVYVKACDIFLYYESIWQARNPRAERPAPPAGLPASLATTDLLDNYCRLLADAVRTLTQRGAITVGASLAPLMRQMRPDFDLASVRLRSFKDLFYAAEKSGYVKLSPHGGDTLVELPSTRENGHAQNSPRRPAADGIPPAPNFSDDAAVQIYYDRILKQRVSRILPAPARHQLYRLSAEILSAPNLTIPLVDLSHQITDQAIAEDKDAGIEQKDAFKILFTLYRARCFHCEQSGDHFNPSIKAKSVDEAEWDARYIRKSLNLLRDFDATIPLRPLPLARLFFDNDDDEPLLAEIINDIEYR